MIISISKANIFQKENLVLQNVDMQINKGEFVYLIGKTGAGKSSLLKTLYGDLALKEGNASVCDFDLVNLKRSKVPYLKKIGHRFSRFSITFR